MEFEPNKEIADFRAEHDFIYKVYSKEGAIDTEYYLNKAAAKTKLDAVNSVQEYECYCLSLPVNRLKDSGVELVIRYGFSG